MQGRKNQYSKDLKKYNFKEIVKLEKNLKIQIRLLALQQVKEGKRIKEVAKIFNVHFQSVRRWLKRLKEGGIKNLAFKKSSGRNRKLTEDEAFKRSVLEMQKDKSGGTIRGIDILKMMEEKFGVKICLSSAYVYLKRAHLVWITGRSKNPNIDLKAQSSFKKTSKIS